MTALKMGCHSERSEESRLGLCRDVCTKRGKIPLRRLTDRNDISHIMNKKVRELVTANGGEIVGEEYFPLDHTDYANTVDKIMSSGAEVVFNTTVPPGVAPFLALLHNAGLRSAGAN